MVFAERLFMMVWDGMRPDFVTPELTPNLVRLAERGVRFDDCHAVYPTVTRVNSASIATGCLPISHGIVGNSLYAPKVDPRESVSIGDHRTLFRLIDTRGGRLVPRDTLADRVHANGGRTVVVSTGSPGSAFLCHPRIQDCPGDRLFNHAIMLPDGARDEFDELAGLMPEPGVPNTEQNLHFTASIGNAILPQLDPRVVIFWHTDPDKTQHHRGLGHPESIQSIRDADAHLGMVIEAYERRGWLDQTAVVVASDHGFATMVPDTGLELALEHAGLVEDVADGRIVLSKNGMTTYVNVVDGGAERTASIVERLLRWEHIGCIFTGGPGRPCVPGTLPLDAVGIGGELAPDIAFSYRWNDDPNVAGVAGSSAGSDAKYAATHGGTSRWETRCTLVMAGPGLKRGAVDDAPTGLIDVSPTLLRLLGVPAPQGQHGRVLEEALLGGPDAAAVERRTETHTTHRGEHTQTVELSVVGDTRYVNFGRGDRA
jgi:arylsulfatase A-like enzyme